MRDDYKIAGPVSKIEIEVETKLVEMINEMEKFSSLTRSELINTAMKRFIHSHKDFLPKHES